MPTNEEITRHHPDPAEPWVKEPPASEVVEIVAYNSETNPADRALYEDAKRAAIPGGGTVMDYNARKQDVIREIYDRLFRAAGML